MKPALLVPHPLAGRESVLLAVMHRLTRAYPEIPATLEALVGEGMGLRRLPLLSGLVRSIVSLPPAAGDDAPVALLVAGDRAGIQFLVRGPAVGGRRPISPAGAKLPLTRGDDRDVADLLNDLGCPAVSAAVLEDLGSRAPGGSTERHWAWETAADRWLSVGNTPRVRALAERMAAAPDALRIADYFRVRACRLELDADGCREALDALGDWAGLSSERIDRLREIGASLERMPVRSVCWPQGWRASDERLVESVSDGARVLLPPGDVPAVGGRLRLGTGEADVALTAALSVDRLDFGGGVSVGLLREDGTTLLLAGPVRGSNHPRGFTVLHQEEDPSRQVVLFLEPALSYDLAIRSPLRITLRLRGSPPAFDVSYEQSGRVRHAHRPLRGRFPAGDYRVGLFGAFQPSTPVHSVVRLLRLEITTWGDVSWEDAPAPSPARYALASAARALGEGRSAEARYLLEQVRAAAADETELARLLVGPFAVPGGALARLAALQTEDAASRDTLRAAVLEEADRRGDDDVVRALVDSERPRDARESEILADAFERCGMSADAARLRGCDAPDDVGPAGGAERGILRARAALQRRCPAAAESFARGALREQGIRPRTKVLALVELARARAMAGDERGAREAITELRRIPSFDRGELRDHPELDRLSD